MLNSIARSDNPLVSVSHESDILQPKGVEICEVCQAIREDLEKEKQRKDRPNVTDADDDE